MFVQKVNITSNLLTALAETASSLGAESLVDLEWLTEPDNLWLVRNLRLGHITAQFDAVEPDSFGLPVNILEDILERITKTLKDIGRTDAKDLEWLVEISHWQLVRAIRFGVAQLADIPDQYRNAPCYADSHGTSFGVFVARRALEKERTEKNLLWAERMISFNTFAGKYVQLIGNEYFACDPNCEGG